MVFFTTNLNLEFPDLNQDFVSEVLWFFLCINVESNSFGILLVRGLEKTVISGI